MKSLLKLNNKIIFYSKLSQTFKYIDNGINMKLLYFLFLLFAKICNLTLVIGMRKKWIELEF